MCVDYRSLNAITIKNRYPLPRVEDLMDQLEGCTVFSSLDLQSGYHQIRITPEDVPKTAFNTPYGHYEYLVLCFGLSNAPATFQAVMNRLLAPLLGKGFVVVYMDDILVFSKNAEEHLQHLEQVLTLLRKEKLYAKLSKCTFNKPEVTFLGHVVGRFGLKPVPTKVNTVRDWQVPTNQREVRQFLGLANYLRKFIQGYSSMAAPLIELTKLDIAWQWGPPQQAAFEQVKQALTTAPVLRLPDFNLPFEVVADASLNGTGAVLMQEHQPICYTSSKFTPAERNYTTGEQELLAVYKALKEWRCYLEGAKGLTLVTDHNPNTYLSTQPSLSRRQARWMQFFSRFHYEWQYRPGRLNVADPLSRSPALNALQAVRDEGKPLEAPIGLQILAGYAADAWFANMRNTEKLTQDSQGFWLVNPGGQLAVPNCSHLKSRIIREHHDTPVSGHQGRDRTLESIARMFWWPGMAAEVSDYVAACDKCQRNKARTGKTPGLMEPLPVPASPWESVTMDFVTGLPPTSSGFDSIFVAVDRLTKMVHLSPTVTTVTAQGAARLFVDNVVKHHGEPDHVVTDRDKVFTGKFFQEYTKLLGTQSRLSTAYHPQTDGQTERANRTLEDMLRAYVSPTPNDWDEHLAAAEFAMNNARSQSTGQTPFFLNYHRHPRTPLQRELGLTVKVPAATASAAGLQDALARAKRDLEAAQQRQKSYYDRNKVPSQLAAGDKVLLSTLNMRRGAGSKLLPKWLGPYEVDELVGPAAVKLRLPETMRIHPTFHVSLVKPYKSNGTVQPPGAPLASDHDMTPIYEVEDVVDHRVNNVPIGRRKAGQRRRYRQEYEFLVKWRGYEPIHNSWVRQSDFAGPAGYSQYCDTHGITLPPRDEAS